MSELIEEVFFLGGVDEESFMDLVGLGGKDVLPAFGKLVDTQKHLVYAETVGFEDLVFQGLPEHSPEKTLSHLLDLAVLAHQDVIRIRVQRRHQS